MTGSRSGVDRRTFLGAAVAGLLAPASFAQGAALDSALSDSEYAYVSPLLTSGAESTCHGEVWYAWIDGAVVVITAHDRWKARAPRRGLTTARVWLGDHGRWKRLIGTNEDFRAAPHFDARVEVATDPELLERMLAVFEKKYPAEIGEWRDKMRNGFKDVRVTFDIKAKASRERIEALMEIVRSRSAVLDIVMNPVPVTVRLGA